MLYCHLSTNVLFILPDAFDETYKKHKRLDIVVNNAAIQDESQWDATVLVNYVRNVKPDFVFYNFIKKNIQYSTLR